MHPRLSCRLTGHIDHRQSNQTMSEPAIDGSGTFGDGDTDCEPPSQRSRPNFKTPELNKFLHNGINEIEQKQLLEDIRNLSDVDDSDGAVKLLLTEVVQNGKLLPLSILQSAGDALQLSSSTATRSGRTNPPPIEPPTTERFTLQTFVEAVEEHVKGNKFSSLSIAKLGEEKFFSLSELMEGLIKRY